MRFGRHARRRLKLYNVTREEAEAAVADPLSEDTDERGNPRFYARHSKHAYIRVVVASDDPDFVISIHPRRKLPH